MQISKQIIDEAAEFLAPRVRRTPLERSPVLERVLGVPVWIKLECLQATGSFKLRGAWFYLSKMKSEERMLGVATCSAGNHGKGLAFAAREYGVPSTVYVPASIHDAQERDIAGLGARVVKSAFQGFDESADWAAQEAAREGLHCVSALDHPWIMAGNGGSLAVEILEQTPEARTFLVPAGSGGLGAGFSFVLKEVNPRLRFVACQHEASPALKLSLERGEAVTRMPEIETLAGGMGRGIGEQAFQVLLGRVDEIALVSEAQIHEAVRWMIREHRILIEPAAAVTLAAALG
ncbi:MAG: pyridoxal-phosphate dependent enzyme, partial [Bdellovibrionales bacterium]|nr:pyridoxal-phosphate dependent enzyme [Bdellovibrionales bacterium]